jgi:IMP dehydrogenase
MKHSQIKKCYSFDDLLLVPKFSEIRHRNSDHIDTSVDLGKGIHLDVPFVSANMKHVTEFAMAAAIAELGGLALLHRFDKLETLKKRWLLLKNKNSNVGVSLGLEDLNVASWYLENDAKILCVDVAHADAQHVHEFVSKVRKLSDEFLLIVGNIVTKTAAARLANLGTDVVKVGIGNGSSCTTRTVTGCGMPQMSALMDVTNNNVSSIGVKVISDGGIQKSGDVVKALCFADLVMIGNMFASAEEAPGQLFYEQVSVDLNIMTMKPYKQYHGSSTFRNNNVEGHKGKVPFVGPIKNIVQDLTEGLMSGMSYQNARNLKQLKNNPEFVEITSSGFVESSIRNT